MSHWAEGHGVGTIPLDSSGGLRPSYGTGAQHSLPSVRLGLLEGSRNPSPLLPSFLLPRPLQSPGPPTSAPRHSLLVGLASGPGAAALTCRHEEDAGLQNDVDIESCELLQLRAESAHEEQNHTPGSGRCSRPSQPLENTVGKGRENAMAVR